MSKNKSTPLRAFEIIFFGKWYYVEIFSQTKIEVYTETEEDLDEEEIKILVKYLKIEGFLDAELTNK